MAELKYGHSMEVMFEFRNERGRRSAAISPFVRRKFSIEDF